jgi:c-di-GMP-binding flagellar brake protein YcgR
MTVLSFFPLQVAIQNFQMDSPSANPSTAIWFLLVLAVIVGLVFLLNRSRKGSNKGKTGQASGIFFTFAVYRIARNAGLNHEQKKMLKFVFKSDAVTDPEKSILTPSLLDKHFRRAYRLIEQTSGSEKEIQHKLAVLFSTRNILENSMIKDMSSTQQIKDDTPLNITFGKEKLQVKVINARGDYIIANSPKNVLGSQIKIPKGTRLSVMFFTKNNKGFSFETRIAGYSSRAGRPTMQLAHSDHLRFLSQRRYRRKHTSIACSLALVYVEGSGKKQRLIVDKRRIKGNIADISVGGCSTKVMSPVQVGARFKIEFMQNDANVAALGQVLRSNSAGMNTVIHVKFLRVSQKSMNAINSFVYEYGPE